MVAPSKSTDQPELDFEAKVSAAPVATIEDVQRLEEILKEHGTLTAAEICERQGLMPTETNKRKIRAVAQAGRPRIVSFPNSTGYKLSQHCTDAEKLACLAAWNSLREEVTKTAVLYSKHFHSLGLKQ